MNLSLQDYISDGNIVGDEERLTRLSNFFVFCLKWILAVIIVFVPLIFFIGYHIISEKSYSVNWYFPWLIYVVSSGLNFANNSILYFWEGCNLISKGQKIRFLNIFINTVIMILCLVFNLKLYSLALSLFLSTVVTSIVIFCKFNKTIKIFFNFYKKKKYFWGKEFFPLLGKYSLSWISGYFIFQIYTPLAFHTYTPAEAGKIGISVTLWSGLLTFSNIWLYVVTPKINMFISKKEWKKLDGLFFKNMFFSVITFCIGLLFIFCCFYLYSDKISILNRFMSLKGMLFLSFGWFLQLVINSLAIYLRSHKEEPLVIPSLVSAAYIIIVTYISVKYLPFDYIFLGFFTSYFFGLPWIIHIFNKKRKEHFEYVGRQNTVNYSNSYL